MNRENRRWTDAEVAAADFAPRAPSPTGVGVGPGKRLSAGFQAKSLDRIKAERDQLVAAMLTQLGYVGLDRLFVREYKFHPERRWRLDLYCDSHRLAIELHGGIYSAGRHTRGEGFTKDREKMNSALELGIRVLEYTPKEIADGSALAQIERVIAAGR